MVQINFARREVICKVVYYGPGMSGKTTNIEQIHLKAPQMSKGQLTSIATEGDRTLFFDFLPLDLGEIAGMRTKFQLYTVPGQVFYNSTRKLVLQGADGVVFVADSDPEKMVGNLESLKNLEENLRELGLNIKSIPLVIQFNKRDLPGASSVDEMGRQLNAVNARIVEAVAFKGEGVMQTLKELAKKVIDRLNETIPSSSTAAQKPTPVPVSEQSVPVPSAPAREPSRQPVAAQIKSGPVSSPTTPPGFKPVPWPTQAASSFKTPTSPVVPHGPAKTGAGAGLAPKSFSPSPASTHKAPLKTTMPAYPKSGGKNSAMLWIVIGIAGVAAAAAVYFVFLR